MMGAAMGEWPWDSGTTSLAGLLGVCILSILLGWLIPLRQHREQIELWKDRCQSLEKANADQDARNDKLIETVGKLVQYAEAADRILKSIPTQNRGGQT